MRIDNFSHIQQLYNSTAKPANSKSASTRGSFMDKLQISDAGKDMQTIRDGLQKTPDIREDRVAALKSAYASGTYQVSTSDLAEKLLAKATETVAF